MTPSRIIHILYRHRPIFPGSRPPSIFGTAELNFCVRDGNRWDLSVIYTSRWVNGDPCGNRTRVTGVRGRCLDRLTNGPWLASRLRRSVALPRRSLKGLATLWIRACVVFDDPSLRSGSSVMCACRRIFHVGAPSGTRTRDPLIKSQLLYQLS